MATKAVIFTDTLACAVLYLSNLRRVGAEAVEGITEIESITRGLTKTRHLALGKRISYP
jgi:hypothetical protein